MEALSETWRLFAHSLKYSGASPQPTATQSANFHIMIPPPCARSSVSAAGALTMLASATCSEHPARGGCVW